MRYLGSERKSESGTSSLDLPERMAAELAQARGRAASAAARKIPRERETETRESGANESGSRRGSCSCPSEVPYFPSAGLSAPYLLPASHLCREDPWEPGPIGPRAVLQGAVCTFIVLSLVGFHPLLRLHAKRSQLREARQQLS